MGVTLDFEQSGEFPDFRRLAQQFPELSARLLGYVGKRAAMQLYAEHLQGQDIMFHARRDASGFPVSENRNPKGGSGRLMVSYRIEKGAKSARVSSFPLNLYENRKQMRSGDEKRRGIMGRRFKSGLSGRLNEYLAAAENIIIGDWLKQGELF